MTGKDKEDARIQKAVNNATRHLANQLEDHRRSTDRMIAAMISKHKAELANKDAKIERLERHIKNIEFSYGAIKKTE